MSSLADLIVANNSDAESVVTSEYPLGEYSGVNVDGLNPVHLAVLHAFTSGIEFNQVLKEYRPVAEASANGPWLIKVPADLIANLVNIAPQDQPSVAAQWVQVDKVRREGWTEQIAEAFLARLTHYAQIASFEGKALFLCAYD
jgi:hypothetical protein